MKMTLGAISIFGLIFFASSSGFSATIQKPEPRFFLITEANAMYRLASKHDVAFRSTDKTTFFSDFIFAPELGFMKRIDNKHTVGASGFFAINTNICQYGVRLRYRLRLDRQIYLYVSPGLILGEGWKSHTEAHLPAFSGQVGIEFSKWLTVKTEIQVIKRHTNYPRTDSRTDVSLFGGVTLGGTPGLVSGIVGSTIYGIIAIVTLVSWGSGGYM